MGLVKQIVEHTHEHALVYRLLVYIIFFSVFFTLVASSVQLYLDYQKDVRQLDAIFVQIEQSYLQSLSLSVWNLDYELIDNILDGIIVLPDIQQVLVEDENGRIIARKGKSEVVQVVSQRFQLNHVDDTGRRTSIGAVQITASLAGIYQRLKERSLVILGTQAVSTFLLAGFIMFIFQYLLTRHLKTMADYTKNLDLDHLEEPLLLNRPGLLYTKPDELDKVTSAINEMVEKLKESSQVIQVKARMEGELNAAAKVQQSFSPNRPTSLEGFDLASLFFPAREVSGDYYDFIRINQDYLALVVADVSGKGVSAAMYANIARVLLHDKSELILEPVELMRSLNHRLKYEIIGHHFLTMSYVLLNIPNAEVTYANAGHEPLVLVRNDQSDCTLLKPPGYPFCELRADKFDERIKQEKYQMNAGDLIFCYTDGLTDTLNERGDFFGEDRLYSLVKKHACLSTNEFLQTIFEAIRSFQGNTDQTDDITMIALKRTNRAQAGPGA